MHRILTSYKKQWGLIRYSWDTCITKNRMWEKKHNQIQKFHWSTISSDEKLTTWKYTQVNIQKVLKRTKQRVLWRFRRFKRPIDRQSNQQVDIYDEKGNLCQEIKYQINDTIHTLSIGTNINDLLQKRENDLNDLLSSTLTDYLGDLCETFSDFLVFNTIHTKQTNILFDLLNHRLQDISVSNRALLIIGIQERVRKYTMRGEKKRHLYFIMSFILLKTYGKDLSLLKEYIESGISLPSNDSHVFRRGDLYQILYQQTNLTTSIEVLQHIAKEAYILKQENKCLIKVISDIDDTLYPGWVDKRFPLHIPYPGVFTLYQQLSHTIKEDSTATITFLTARPRGWFSFGKKLTLNHLLSLGVQHSEILAGSIHSLTSKTRMANQKYENFRRYLTLFPEYKYVFFGDSGQGDVVFALKLLQDYPDKMRAIFIHDITSPNEQTKDKYSTSSYVEENGIYYYRNYFGAGVVAKEKGLLTQDNLIHLSKQCQQDLLKIKTSSLYTPRHIELLDDMKNYFESSGSN